MQKKKFFRRCSLLFLVASMHTPCTQAANALIKFPAVKLLEGEKVKWSEICDFADSLGYFTSEIYNVDFLEDDTITFRLCFDNKEKKIEVDFTATYEKFSKRFPEFLSESFQINEAKVINASDKKIIEEVEFEDCKITDLPTFLGLHMQKTASF